MARKPRPVNPGDGPLQAFAYDLRAVREAAGNPTYRALAGIAGFGATTLSDAAGGVRKPSLEVTLAYVGACRGDVGLWERRWRDLDRLLEGECPDASDGKPSILKPEEVVPATGPQELEVCDSAEAVGDEGEDATEVKRRLRWLWWPVSAVVIALVVTASLLATRPAPRAVGASVASACPDPGPGTALFNGKTYAAVTRVRDSAELNATVLREIPAGCAVKFTGYCLGDVVIDSTSGTPDMRWFQVSGGGVVASAVVHGNPPSGLRPTACPGSVAMPVSVALSVVPPADGSDLAELKAVGVQAGIVGFAAYYADPGHEAQPAKWHQLGITKVTTSGFTLPWRLGALRGRTAAQGSLPVVAVACLGGDGPTAVADALALPPGTLTPAQPASLAPADLTRAEASACAYQTPN